MREAFACTAIFLSLLGCALGGVLSVIYLGWFALLAVPFLVFLAFFGPIKITEMLD
jgi:hypothetical protein